LLLSAGFQLERARTLLAEPGDLTIDDIQEFIALSSAREESERKEREAALKRDEARVAQIKAGQERTERLRRITRLAFAAVGAVILIAGATVGYLQRDKAKQLDAKEVALAESRQQLDKAQASVFAEQASNAALTNSLNRRQVDLDHAQANILGELSGTRLLRGEFDSALRLASHSTRIDLALPSDAVKASPAAAALAAAVSQANWRFVLSGHDDAVNSAAFSPDGTRIVTASGDGTARLWDAATAKEIAVLRGHDESVHSAAFSPGGTRIVTASSDNTARIWDAASAKEVAVLRGHETIVYSAAFSPDGRRIVTASGDKTARLWDAATAKQIAVLRGHDDFVASAAFSPDGRRIVTASGDKTARIWDAATAKEIATLRGHDGYVTSAAFSPDGTRIVTASLDETARIWDAATAKEIAVLRGHDDTVTSAAFSPDGTRIITASETRPPACGTPRPPGRSRSCAAMTAA
jgi:Tol biopolymer transport system component